jgi:hypothetical protein
MIQCGSRTCLALKTLERLRVFGEFLRKKLQGNMRPSFRSSAS